MIVCMESWPNFIIVIISTVIFGIRFNDHSFLFCKGPDPSYISVPVVLGGKQSVLNFVEADMYTQVNN